MPFEDLSTYLSEHEIESADDFRKKKETAILVIMFIDMVHSTELRETMGEVQFQNLSRSKKQELAAIIERDNHGKIIKDLGDGLLTVFAIPDIAVRSALEIQETLVSHPSIKVRIGLDMGQVAQESEKGIVKDVFGRHVNRAARLEALSDGGHVLVSYPVWDSAQGWLKHVESIHWKKHGSYYLKGLAEPQIIYEAYDVKFTKPLPQLNGEQVSPEEELTYCHLCGRYVKFKETFTCRTCGTSGICIQYCYDAKQRQCLECSAKMLSVSPEQHPSEPSPVSEAITPPAVAQTESEGVQPEFDVLLCYAPQDKTFVLHLVEYLRHEGLRVWIDEEQLDIGDQVPQKIAYGLQNSRFVVVCLSKHFTDSIWSHPECAAHLIQENKTHNAKILPIIVGDYDDRTIPDFLYDKYSVDIRTNQGLERLLRKIAPVKSQEPVESPVLATQQAVPQALQAEIANLQTRLLWFAKQPAMTDEVVVEFDKVSIALFNVLERFPDHNSEFHEIIAAYQTLAEKLLSSVADQEYRRVLAFRVKKVEECVEDLAGGFHCGESFLGKQVDATASQSPYAVYTLEFTEAELETWVKKLLSGKELEESEGLDWLLRAGLPETEIRLQQIAELQVLDKVFTVLWKRAARVFLYYNESFWELLKFMLKQNPLKWKLRFHALKLLLKRSLTPSQASEILANFIPAETRVLSGFLLLHPKHECRELALNLLPSDDRWDVLLCPNVPFVIIKELVEKSCQDSSDSYIKALFLLLRPRLLAVDTPLALREAYQMLNLFYHKPLFLQETFFEALIDLHKQLRQKAEANPLTQHLEQGLKQTFQAFCAKGKLKDVDIQELKHIPLPIQRKLAHDGYLPKFFICNVRDVIALETVPHVEHRPDVLHFFRLRPINGRALEQLATNDLIMKEYQNRAAFCRNPKANPLLLRRYLSTLTKLDLKEIARDRNVSNFARELATKYLSRYGH